MAPLVFGAKAETLERLQGRLTTARLLPQITLTARAWRARGAALLEPWRAAPWSAGPCIVRSSARDEDLAGSTLAGHYLSRASGVGESALVAAIDAVVERLDEDHDGHLFFIQPLLAGVTLGGVAFSREPSTGAPYYVINYDDHSGATDSVTGGRSNALATYYHHKHHAAPPADPRLAAVLALLRELERLFGHDSLDVEFAFAADTLTLLQVRPLLIPTGSKADEADHYVALEQVADKVARLLEPHPYLKGPRSVLGVMPDWNPAEIIGVRPRPLALSLYKTLITDNIWAYQRDNYGYRNLRSFPLLVSLHGAPYIDVRVSFNSFVPRDLEEAVAERLVNHYLDCLIAHPEHHDKVEFDILFSCYTLDLPERLASLREAGFSEVERAQLLARLRELTNNVIDPRHGLWRQDQDKIARLEERQQVILDSALGPVERMYWLLEDCKRYGTLPFAGLARAAFMAVQLLHSMVAVGVLDPTDLHTYLAQVETVGSRSVRDFHRLSRGAFLARYGHLRPNTYDMLTPRYDEAPERYFNWDEQGEVPPDPSPFTLAPAQRSRIEILLMQHGINTTVDGLFAFIRQAIQGREYAKFVFTRSVSDVLRLFAGWGRELGFDDADLSLANIHLLDSLYSSSDDPRSVLAASIAEGRRQYEVTQRMVLPPLISAPEQVFAFHQPRFQPNYIGLGELCAETVADVGVEGVELAGRIVFIPNADPGYDWIFSRRIAGLVTQYGGSNSHMAIRASELGLPAVIGAGETLFNRWRSARRLHIDCANRLVRVLQ